MCHIDDKNLTHEEFILTTISRKARKMDKEDVDARSASVRVLHSASRKKREELEEHCMVYIDA